MAKHKKPLVEFTDEEIAKYRKAFLINTLRRASYRWPWRNIAAQQARVARGQYRCFICNAIVSNKLKKMDHVYPVVDPYIGNQGFDIYTDRLLPGIKGFQCLCKVCHDNKTAEEREIRKMTKRNNK